MYFEHARINRLGLRLDPPKQIFRVDNENFTMDRVTGVFTRHLQYWSVYDKDGI